MITLGLDVSTQSCTAVAVDAHAGTTIYEKSLSFDALGCIAAYGLDEATKTLRAAGAGEYGQPPGMFLFALDALFAAMKREGFSFASVRAVSISAQQHGHVYLTKDFFAACTGLHTDARGGDLQARFAGSYAHAAAPIWMTSNTREEAAHLASRVPDILQRSGSQSPLRFTGAVIRKTALDSPQDYERTARIHLLSSFAASILSGNPNAPADVGNGAGTSLMNYAARRWDAALCAACAEGLPGGEEALMQKLPELQSPLFPAGTIARYFSEAYGFDPACRVFAGSGDNPQSKSISQDALLSLGSSFVMMSASTPAEAVAVHPHANASYDGLSRAFLFACRTNGALVWDRVRSHYGADLGAAEAALARVAVGAAADALPPQPLEESFPPSPARDGTGNFSGDFAADYAACVDGALALTASYSEDALQCKGISRINLTGGPAASAHICLRVSAFWNCPVVPVGQAGAALGAAVSAAKAYDDAIDAQALSGALCGFEKAVQAPAESCARAREYALRLRAKLA